MVIDTSAILAILSNEPEATLFAEKIATSETCCMSAASLFESAIIVESRYGAAGGQKLDELVLAADIAVEPVTADQMKIARVAYRTFKVALAATERNKRPMISGLPWSGLSGNDGKAMPVLDTEASCRPFTFLFGQRFACEGLE